MNTRRAAAGLAVCFVIAVVVVLALSGGGGKSATPELATASVRSFPVVATTTGTVSPASQIGVNFTTSGMLTEVDVTVGTHVTKGQLLARFDDSVAQAGVAQAEASLAAARASLTAAQRPLAPGQAVVLQQQVASARAELAQVESDVAATNAADKAAVNADNQHSSNSTATTSDPSSAPSTTTTADPSASADSTTTTADPGASAGTTSTTADPSSTATTSDPSQAQLQADTARQQSDATSGQLRIAEAQARLDSANAALSAATTPNPAEVAAAQASIASSEAQLQHAQAELAGTTLTAPADGTIQQVNGQVGENVSAAPTGTATLPGTTAPLPTPSVGNATATAPTSFIVMGNDAGVVIGAPFTAADAPQLMANQTGTLTAETISGLSVPCHVLAVASNPTDVNGVARFYATVIPDGANARLLPGTPVDVTITITNATNVLAVPTSSIYVLDGQPHVDVWYRGHAVSTPVTTGLQGVSLVEVKSGLTDGQQVVLSAPFSLSKPAVSPPTT